MKILNKIIDILGNAITALGFTGLVTLGIVSLWIFSKPITIFLFILACVLMTVKTFKKDRMNDYDET